MKIRKSQGHRIKRLATHKRRHQLLHKMFDELVADWIAHTHGFMSTGTIMDLIIWSSKQTKNPTEEE